MYMALSNNNKFVTSIAALIVTPLAVPTDSRLGTVNVAPVLNQ